MKHLLIAFILLSFKLFSQGRNQQLTKQPLDSSVFNKWLTVQNPSITSDGHYALYFIVNNSMEGSTLVLKSIINDWEMRFQGVIKANFTSDSRGVVFINSGDSLFSLQLGSSIVEFVPYVKTFSLVGHENTEWLIYIKKSNDKELIVKDINRNIIRVYSQVSQFWTNNFGNRIIIKKQSFNSIDTLQTLCYINNQNGNELKIWEGRFCGNVIFDETGSKVAFITESKQQNIIYKSIWFYQEGRNKSIPLAGFSTFGSDTLKIEKIIRFSTDGNSLYFLVKKEPALYIKKGIASVDIWSYLDEKLQPQQLKEAAVRSTFDLRSEGNTAVINLVDRKVVMLDREGESLRFFEGRTDSLALIIKRRGDPTEESWNVLAKPFYYLICCRTGERKSLQMIVIDISPNGQYLICEDQKRKSYYSYELATGIMKNLTASIKVPKSDKEYDFPGIKPAELYGIAGWLDNDTCLLIYDKYDIWKLTLKNNIAPINITHGIGRKNNIVFRISSSYPIDKVFGNEVVILSAFNRRNKNNGFYNIDFGKKMELKELTMGPYVYDVHLGPVSMISEFGPIKARDTSIYIVRRMNAKESPNFFWTTDFTKMNDLSSVYPEANYNWLKSELLTWKGLGGQLQGVLYKPENFNYNQKYPIIFMIYERLSDELNLFRQPEPLADRINIPWFVSRGYLVFTPDIYYKVGYPGNSAYKSVVSAVKYISNLPYVDTYRMGIQGHSFGGYETNYIITHTNLFAAAMSASGISDLVSGYGSIAASGGFGLQFFYESDQNRIGSTLWKQTELYLKNSPVFFLDRVATPVLMMSNKEDGIVPFSQGVEFFTGLRRLGKKVWMLQYDQQKHSLTDIKARLDYTIRVTQFFDHYLMGSAMPKWMLDGIPAKVKGVDDGYNQ